MVIVSHDREFLDQLCTKIVETDAGVSTTYKGNYTEFVAAKKEAIAQQYIAFEKQQKEINRLVGLILSPLDIVKQSLRLAPSSPPLLELTLSLLPSLPLALRGQHYLQEFVHHLIESSYSEQGQPRKEAVAL